MTRFTTPLAEIWRLALPYFWSEDRRAGRVLLAAVIAIELALVAINVLLNQWNATFYNALQDRDWNAFVYQLGYFCVLVAAFILLAVYQLYLNQWLQIRWRSWMTETYLKRWIGEAAQYRMQLVGEAADNPDQRIAEDIKLFVDSTLTLSIQLLSSVVTMASFVAILWGLSAAAPLTIGGTDWTIPGYLVWTALAYAVLGTWLTHWIGAPLAGLNFMQQRFEADFRFNLVRVRENAEQIALLRGEDAERARLGERFTHVVRNWRDIMNRQKKLTFFTAGYAQISTVIPFIVVSPAYFAGKMQLGGLMQTASAFSSVQGALSFFISFYRQLAEWRAVVVRLNGFIQATEAARQHALPQGASPGAAPDAIALAGVRLDRPEGTPLLAAPEAAFRRGTAALVSGPSGAGKSTLFRYIAGIWPFGRGAVEIPQGAHVLLLPQRPYFPVATLAAALAYPGAPDAFTPDDYAAALKDVGLPALLPRLDEEAHWNRFLSPGEQQRLAIARALLQKPDFLFLDEATASLDEASEDRLYRVLRERLPQTALVSIGHRASLAVHHAERLVLEPGAEGHHLVAAPPRAAE